MSYFEYYNDLDSHFKELLIFSSSFFCECVHSKLCA